jgi:ankyrin repeat protein
MGGGIKKMGWADVKNQVSIAIREGKLDLISKLVKEHPKLLKVHLLNGKTILHEAVSKGNIEIMNLFVNEGMDINIPEKYEDGVCFTPLHSAVFNDNILAAKWLIENGANVDAGIYSNATPLISASRQGNLEMVKLLIESGADINAYYVPRNSKTLNKMNAITAAQFGGHHKVVEYLLNLDLNQTQIIDKDSEILKEFIEKNFGPIERTLSEIIPGSDVSISIHLIAPTRDQDYYTLVTSGMSDLPMEQLRPEYRYVELFIKLPSTWSFDDLKNEENYWPLRWLRRIAHSPHDGGDAVFLNHAYFSDEPNVPFCTNTQMTCLMVSAANDECCRKLNHSNGMITNFYTLIPIYENEWAFAKVNRCETLLKRLADRGIGEVWDLSRGSIV